MMSEVYFSVDLVAHERYLDRNVSNIFTGVSRMGRFLEKVYDPTDKNLKLKIFLALVSLFIIGIVITTWHLYHQKVLEAFIGSRIRLLEKRRVLKLVEDGKVRLEGLFGRSIPHHLLPYDCQHSNRDSHICLEWKYRATVKVHTSFDSENIHCFRVAWESLIDDFLEDCFYLKSASFYGMGEAYPQLWPINLWTKPKSPFVTGNAYNSFGSNLERYWLTSTGASIMVDNEVPLYVSINEGGNQKLCLESIYDGYPYKRLNQSSMPHLSYELCVGDSFKTTHRHITKKFWSKKNENVDTEMFWDYFSNPVWSSYPYLSDSLNDSTLLSFANSVMQSGFKPGVLLIDGRWEEYVGDLDFNPEAFSSADDTLTTLRNKGFRNLLTVSPYTSIKSSNFEAGLDERYFIFDSQQNMPLLTNWSALPVAIIDFSSTRAKTWISENVKMLREQYKIDGFNFVGGEASYLPNSYNSEKSAENPDIFNFEYKNFTYHQNIPVSFISSSVFRGSLNISSNLSTTGILTLTNRKPDWSSSGGLKSIIPSVLSLGLLGNTIIDVGPVGGGSVEMPDQELFIRWMQLSTFMPVIQFSVPPFEYDDEVMDITDSLLEIRKSTVIPNFKKSFKKDLIEGSPMVKPLWWLIPSDPVTLNIDDQFLINDNVIVAPVLTEGATKRDIYLPEGWWRDELRGVATRGKKWMYDYEVPIDKVPYFVALEEYQAVPNALDSQNTPPACIEILAHIC
ncbi:Myogenesis-regulating glycosidase [Nymphon striatum]|nr:Myogenesis-regulating glycosidase [Nymphon striatum]